MRDAIERSAANNALRQKRLDERFAGRRAGTASGALTSIFGGIEQRGLDRERAEIEPQLAELETQRRSALATAIGGGENLSTPELQRLRSKQLERKIAPTQVTSPSAVREFEFVKKLSPEDRQRFVNLKRADPLRAKGLVENVEGQVEELSGFGDAIGGVKEAEKFGEFRAKFRAQFPKVTASAEAQLLDFDELNQDIDDIIPDISGFTAGVGSLVDFAPGTPQRDLAANLDTILAKVGFQKLSEMRANSPTGGALGNVTENEIKFLQASVSNVQNSQSPAQLKENLQKLKKRIGRSRRAIERAYKRDLKTFGIDDVPPLESGFDDTAQPVTQPTQGVIEALPQGATQIGTSGGKPVFRTPDGKTFIQD